MSFVPVEINSVLFSYERLCDNDNQYYLHSFTAINNADGITEYFNTQAFNDENDYSVRSYVVKLKDTEIVIAYFTLKCGSIPFMEDAINLTFSKETKLISGIELVNIALNDKALRIIKQLHIQEGKNIFYDIVQPIVKHVSEEIGTKVLYLFAINQKLADYYKTWGFESVDDEPYNERLNQDWQNEYSQKCIFMYKSVAEI